MKGKHWIQAILTGLLSMLLLYLDIRVIKLASSLFQKEEIWKGCLFTTLGGLIFLIMIALIVLVREDIKDDIEYKI